MRDVQREMSWTKKGIVILTCSLGSVLPAVPSLLWKSRFQNAVQPRGAPYPLWVLSVPPKEW